MPDTDRTNQQQALLARLDEELRELAKGVSAYRAAQSPVLGERFRRWKDRSREEIRRAISTSEADRFAQLPVQPHPLYAATWAELLERHHAHLVALAEDIACRPHEFSDAGPPKGSATPAATRRPYTGRPPKEGTLAWLNHNVPMSFWLKVGGLLLGAFAAGVKAGQHEVFVRFVAPILRIEVRPPAATPIDGASEFDATAG